MFPVRDTFSNLPLFKILVVLEILIVNIEFLRNEKLETFGILSKIVIVEYRKFYKLSIKACF